MRLKPEIEFLRACCRGNHAPDFPAYLRVLSGRIDNWSIVIGKLATHGVESLVYARLQDVDPSAVPEEVLRVLADRAAENAVKSLLQISELADVLEDLSAGGIVAVPFKGPLMSAALYGKASLRFSVDLDFLIREQDRGTARRVLEKQGYLLETTVDAAGQPLEPGKNEYHFEGAGKTAVEVRWRITQPQFGASLDLDYILRRLRDSEVAGVKIRAIAPEDLLLILTAHGAKHRWERWMWLCDVDALIRSNPALDWKSVCERAAGLGLARVVRFSLLLAHHLLKTLLPDQMLAEAQGDPEAGKLAAETGELLLGFESSPDEGEYHLRILDGGDRARHQLRHWTGLWVPNERDRQFVVLPKALNFAYWLVRPVRLLSERFASSGS